mmetsp:Transcript_34179/g.94027  ORF Transcript_34179/g.94027 Transcript_34179/m.94027 type:complete len:328 (+) Transcript_34179:6317-7300(+)
MAARAPINDVVDGGTKRLKLVATRSLADHQRHRIPVCECFQQLLLVVKGPRGGEPKRNYFAEFLQLKLRRRDLDGLVEAERAHNAVATGLEHLQLLCRFFLDLLCVLALTASRAALSLFEELLVHKSVGQERELSHPSVWDQPAVPVDPPSSQRQLVDLNVFALRLWIHCVVARARLLVPTESTVREHELRSPPGFPGAVLECAHRHVVQPPERLRGSDPDPVREVALDRLLFGATVQQLLERDEIGLLLQLLGVRDAARAIIIRPVLVNHVHVHLDLFAQLVVVGVLFANRISLRKLRFRLLFCRHVCLQWRAVGQEILQSGLPCG